jgi:HlyD family secretion protein
MNRMLGTATVLLLFQAAVGCSGRRDPGQILASGHVEATHVRVSTKVAGRLETLSIAEGDQVSTGQEMGRIDTVDLRLSLRQAKAEHDQAAAELRLRLAGARKEDIAELEAQIASVAVDLARRDMTAAKLVSMKEALARLRAGSREEEKDAARARVAAAEARIAQLEQQIKDALITSPLPGVVTEKIAEAGELLQVGSPLGEVTNLADAWLTVYVPEADLARIRFGQEAEVTTDGGQKRTGKVSFVASQAEFTPKNVQTRDERVKLVFKVKIALENADGVFKPGMPAEARLQAVDGTK